MKILFNSKFLLLGIILIAFLLRFWQLGEIPGFFADEAAFGYNSYSILHTGKDEYGKSLPLVLKSFGDYKGAIYSYIDIPFISVFGLSPFAVRLPSIIFSVLTILILYLLVKNVTQNNRIALISGFLLAISPWDLIISRVVGDVTIGVFFMIAAVYFLQRLLAEDKIKWFTFTTFFIILAVLSEPVFRFSVVLISLTFLVLSFKKTKRGISFNKKIFYIIFLSIFLSLIYSFIASINRFNQVSIFSTPQTDLVLQEQIREDEFTSPIITRFFHNKIVNYTRTVLLNAGQYFTLDFLALNGGYPKRERIPDSGLFYIWELPFLLIGIYTIVKSRNKNLILFLLWWVILLTPSFITFDEIPNVHRTIVVLPAMCVIIAIGIFSITSYKPISKAKFLPLFLLIFLVVAVFEFLYFNHQYFSHYDKHQAWYRGNPYKEFVADLQKYYVNYKKIIVTKSLGSPYIYVLFYSQYDPEKYQLEGSPRDLDYTGFDKYYFVPLDCPLKGGRSENEEVFGERGILYVDKGDCVSVSRDVKVLDTIRWKDGNPAFKLLEYSPKI